MSYRKLDPAALLLVLAVANCIDRDNPFTPETIDDRLEGIATANADDHVLDDIIDPTTPRLALSSSLWMP